MNELVVIVAMKLLFVKEIEENESAVVVRFEGGVTGQLPRDGRETTGQSVEYARRGLKEKYPVAVTIVKGDRIATIDSADSDTVDYVKDSDSERFRVAFRGHAAVYRLRKDNPDLRRVKAVLEQSAKDQSLIWLSLDVDPRKMLVVDALPMEHIAKKDPGSPKAATHTTTR